MQRASGFVIGLVFGVTLVWTGMTSPDVIREALLFEDSYLFLFFGSAVLTSVIGLRLVRGREAVLARGRVDWRPERLRIVAGAVEPASSPFRLQPPRWSLRPRSSCGSSRS